MLLLCLITMPLISSGNRTQLMTYFVHIIAIFALDVNLFCSSFAIQFGSEGRDVNYALSRGTCVRSINFNSSVSSDLYNCVTNFSRMGSTLRPGASIVFPATALLWTIVYLQHWYVSLTLQQHVRCRFNRNIYFSVHLQ